MVDDLKIGTRALYERPRTQTFEDLAKLDARVAVVETVAAMGGKRTSTLSILGFVAAIAFPIGALIFAAGQYPTRAEFDDARKTSEKKLEDLREIVAGVQREQVRQSVRTEAMVEAQEQISADINRALAPKKRK